jgi:exonuclease VII large subunit
VITSAKQVSQGDALEITVADGSIPAVAGQGAPVKQANQQTYEPIKKSRSAKPGRASRLE